MKPIRHGDVYLYSSTLPKGAKFVRKATQFVVAHGETGHKHVMAVDREFDIYEHENITYYVVPVGDPALLTHEEHDTQEIPAGVYRQAQEIEYDPFSEAIRQVAD